MSQKNAKSRPVSFDKSTVVIIIIHLQKVCNECENVAEEKDNNNSKEHDGKTQLSHLHGQFKSLFFLSFVMVLNCLWNQDAVVDVNWLGFS